MGRNNGEEIGCIGVEQVGEGGAGHAGDDAGGCMDINPTETSQLKEHFGRLC